MTVPAFARPARLKKKMAFGVVLFLLVGGGWAAHRLIGSDAEAKRGGHGDSPTVSLSSIEKGDLNVIDQALGTVTPLVTVTVRTQIAGQLQEIAFQEGQKVSKGDFLAQIDPRPYQMTLEQATGALQKDQALLKDAQVMLARYKKLAAQDSIAKQQLDTQEATVQQYQGAVTTDQGQIDAAKLDIDYCHIVAPISGRIGLRQVDVGNYVQTSDANGLVVLTQVDPISVMFTLPEDALPAVMKRLSAGGELKVIAFDRTQSAKLAEGKLVAVDNQINTSTGSVKLRAQFDNADDALFPNQFVNIQIVVDTVRDAVIAPQAAILRGAAGSFVYLAKDDETVVVRPVKLGVTQGDKVQIAEGLIPGDKVVVDGTDKLRDGAKYRLSADDKNGNAEAGKSGYKNHASSSVP